MDTMIMCSFNFFYFIVTIFLEQSNKCWARSKSTFTVDVSIVDQFCFVFKALVALLYYSIQRDPYLGNTLELINFMILRRERKFKLHSYLNSNYEIQLNLSFTIFHKNSNKLHIQILQNFSIMNEIMEDNNENQRNSSSHYLLQMEQIQDQSAPLPIHDQNSKRKKKYKCRYCNLAHHSLKYVSQIHRYKCKERSKIKNLSTNRRIRQGICKEKIYQMQETFKEQQKDRDKLEQEQQLQKRVKILEENYIKITQTNNLSNINKSKLAQIFTKQIFEDVGSLLVGNLKMMFKSAAEKALHSGLDIVSQKNSITESLILSVQQVKLGQVFFDFVECLKVAHEKIQKKIMSKNPEETRTYQNNQRAFQFFSKFNHFHFQFQGTLLKQLMLLKKFPRNDSIRYFNLLRQSDPFFSRFPKLNKIDGKISNPRPLVNLEDIVQKIVQLYDSNQKQLCCDVWFCACLGLRGSELLRVKVQSNSGQFVKSVRILERKNSNLALRYLPESLIELIRLTKSAYPMSVKRLKQTKQFCISSFRSFYTLRHTCLTNILSALASLNEYGRFHKSALTTTKFYINQNQQVLINRIFKLPFKYEKPEVILTYERNILLDLSGSYPLEIRLEANKEFEISIDNVGSYSEQQDADSILNGDIIPIESVQSQKDKLKLHSQIYLYQNHNCSVEDGSSNIKETLKKLVNPTIVNDYEEKLQQALSFEGKYPDVASCIQEACKVLRLKIHYYEFFNNSPAPEVSIFGKGSNKAVIAKNNDQFFVDDQTIVSKWDENLQQDQEIVSNQNVASHSNRSPLCPECDRNHRKGYLEYTVEDDRISIQCFKCEYHKFIGQIEQIKVKPKLHEQQLQIRSIHKKRVQKKFKSLNFTKEANNFKETIEKQYGEGSYANRYYFCTSIPKIMQSAYYRMGEQLQKEIEFNRLNQEFLPLSIRPSSLANGGLGVFSRCPIPKDTIVLSYLGIVCDVENINIHDDSLFSIGWFLNKAETSTSRQMYIMPRFRLNAGRFINSSDRLNKANCRIGIGIFREKQIALYIYTCKNIASQQELFYSYGSSYWKNKTNKQ